MIQILGFITATPIHLNLYHNYFWGRNYVLSSQKPGLVVSQQLTENMEYGIEGLEKSEYNS